MSTRSKTRRRAADLKRTPPVPKTPTLRAAVKPLGPTGGSERPLEIVEKCDLECKDCNLEKWCR